MAAWLCPHCDNRSLFTIHHQAQQARWGDPSDYFHVRAMFCVCSHCNGLLIQIEKLIDGDYIDWKFFPNAVPKIDKTVPENIATDFISGVNCASIGEYKAAACMFRRSLQQIMIEKGIQIKGNILRDEINELETKNVINSQLKDLGHEIRFWGNEGAHPSRDGLDEITLEELARVQTFLELLFDYIYVLPAKIQASRNDRSQRKTP